MRKSREVFVVVSRSRVRATPSSGLLMLLGERYLRPLRDGHLAPPSHWNSAALDHGYPTPLGDINLAPLSDWDPRPRGRTTARPVSLATRLVH